MLIIRNAWKSIIRAKGRNILIGIIVVTIAIAACISLSIRNAAATAQETALENVRITAGIRADMSKLRQTTQQGGSGKDMREQMRENMEKYQDLKLDELLRYADSDYVKEFLYHSAVALDTTGELLAYGAQDDEEDDENGNENGGLTVSGDMRGGPGGGGNFMVIGGSAMGDLSVTGYNSEADMTDFQNGSSKITDGSMIDLGSKAMDCLVSADFAAYNSLKVGDNIKLANPSKQEETYSFTIKGIYSSTAESEQEGMMRISTMMDPANQIYISYPAVAQLIVDSEKNATTETDDNGRESSTALVGRLTSSYVFASAEHYNSFTEEVRAKGLDENYTVSSNDLSSYESSIAPLKSLSSNASKLLWIVLAVGAVILIVLNLFNIRERKYEVGVLTAIGIKKRKVAAQFVTELLSVTLVAILIGAAIGVFACVPVADSMLATQVSAQEAQDAAQNESFGRDGPSASIGGSGGPQSQMMTPGGRVQQFFGSGTSGKVEYLKDINANMNLTVLLQLLAIGLVLTILSSFVAIVFVMRYEPLKILANRA